MALRGPPCWLKTMGNLRRSRSRAVSPRLRERISPLMEGFPSSTGAKRGSTSTEIRKSGRQECSAAMAGVSSTKSPSERGRIIRISAPCGNAGSRVEGSFEFGGAFNFYGVANCAASFGFNAGFINQHHRDVFANRIDAMARRALQAALVAGQLHRRFILRANQNVEQFLRNGHEIPPRAL